MMTNFGFGPVRLDNIGPFSATETSVLGEIL